MQPLPRSLPFPHSKQINHTQYTCAPFEHVGFFARARQPYYHNHAHPHPHRLNGKQTSAHSPSSMCGNYSRALCNHTHNGHTVLAPPKNKHTTYNFLSDFVFVVLTN